MPLKSFLLTNLPFLALLDHKIDVTRNSGIANCAPAARRSIDCNDQRQSDISALEVLQASIEQFCASSAAFLAKQGLNGASAANDCSITPLEHGKMAVDSDARFQEPYLASAPSDLEVTLRMLN